MQKRALAIHDISCIGRCSLTVVLPILSAGGIETSVLPTALLSTHTGEFTGYTYRDLTGDILSITGHWQSFIKDFDVIFSGFLGSYKQISIIRSLFTRFSADHTFIMVDPAMADNGKLYATYTDAMARQVKRLCEMADIIVPNVTEASILLDEPYQAFYDQSKIESMLRRLSAMGPKQVVLTGFKSSDGKIGSAAYDRSEQSVSYAFSERYDRIFYGTGDVFASVLLLSLLSGKPLKESNETADQFTHRAIEYTLSEGRPLRYGVAYEKVIPWLIRRLNL